MKFKKALLVVCAVGLAGCDQFQQWRNPAIKACRAQLLEKLKSPASYKEIDIVTNASPISKGEYGRLNSALYGGFDGMLPSNPAVYSVVITYDAANSFGADLRDKELCQFTIMDIDDVPSEIEANGSVDMMRNRIDAETGEPEPCCLTAFQKREPQNLGIP